MEKLSSNHLSLATLIDHTFLKPEATQSDIERLCQEAMKHDFWSVCISPSYVDLANSILEDSSVKICTVVGFPHGTSSSQSKAFEAGEASRKGADEIDMVINIGALKSQAYDYLNQEIQMVRKVIPDKVLKVIIESGLLTTEEKIAAATLVQAAGADFVKTSTGFNGGGATVDDIKLLRSVVGSEFGVKASGGIRDKNTAEAMIQAGATRLGASSSVAIVTDNAKDQGQGGY